MVEFGLTNFSVFFAGILTDIIIVRWSLGGLAIMLVIL
jgi:hypothetical protein